MTKDKVATIKSILLKSVIATLSAALIVFITLCLTPIFGNGSQSADEPVIAAARMENLNIVANIDKNRDIEITETFSMTFLKSGLTEAIRYVPYAGFEYRSLDGEVETKATYNHITNIEGSGEHNEKLKIYLDEMTGYITIGFKSGTYFEQGETRNYTISYTYQLANDTNEGFDDIYFNIVGTDSDIEIDNVSFTVTLPDGAKNIRVYTGENGSTDELTTTSVGETIMGSVLVLPAHHGITIRAVYEDGFFSVRAVRVNGFFIVGIVVAVLSILLTILCWRLFAHNDKYPRPVEVTAPDGVTPMMAEGIFKKITNKSIPATVVYLASQGFIKIIQHDEDSFEFQKLRELDAQQSQEVRTVFDAMFKGANAATTNDFNEDFVAKCVSARILKQKQVNNQLVDKSVRSGFNGLRVVTLLLALVSLVATFVGYFNTFTNSGSVFILFYAFLVFAALAGIVLGGIFSEDKWPLILVLCYVVFLVSRIYFSKVWNITILDPYYLGMIGIILAFIPYISLLMKPRLNREGEQLKGRVEGFREFIEKCEVSQIQHFCNENPNYFFDVLPYAYVFGLTDVWMDKLSKLTLKYPDWIETDDGAIMNGIIFSSIMHNVYSSTRSAYSKSAAKFYANSSGESGGFGGGGFSGGGSGGGGFGAR